ncbi:hypothetical protein DBR40_21415 [Pedobacter sp. KBW01]|uniref:restriction endonuclease n=1 Tax=Pedobacter sp. KBW01 TaxID=2153364 RepID=UPI000F59B4FE|nr:restriction endonuclease [Pedobacter sp. KBW01]RQO66816.1 hypothetical protein DBR40_21415 [Pedobacter sp. KBW01]
MTSNNYINDPRISQGAKRDITTLIDAGWLVVSEILKDNKSNGETQILPAVTVFRHGRSKGDRSKNNSDSFSYWQDLPLHQDDLTLRKILIGGYTLINGKFLDNLQMAHTDMYGRSQPNFKTELKEYELENDAGSQPFSYLTEADKVKAIIETVYQDNKMLYKIGSYEFERMIAELLRAKNFEVELTKRTRDGGYDILALQNLEGIPLRFLVECKRYAAHKPIGIDIIRSFSHVVNREGANKGLIFTTSYFTRDASKLRDDDMPYLLDFKDNIDIVKWVNRYMGLGK